MEHKEEVQRSKLIKNAVIAFGIILSLFVIDMLCIYFNDKPLFYTRQEEDKKDNNKVYHGLIFKVYDCGGNIELRSLGSDFYCGYISEDAEFKIIDEVKSCPDVLEKIHEDLLHTYYLPCIKSTSIRVVYKDGTTYTLRDVIDNKMLTIEELMDNGLKVIKENKI